MTIRALGWLSAVFLVAACRHEHPAAATTSEPVAAVPTVPTPVPVVQPATRPTPTPAPAAAVTRPAPPRTVAQLRKAKMLAEVVLRLKGTDLGADAETRATVDKALAANKGLPAFVEIAEAFGLTDHDDDLLRLAIDHPNDATGALALRLVLKNGGLAAVTKELDGNVADADAMAEALGNANDQRVVALLAPIVGDSKRELGLRQECVRALGKYEGGAQQLLQLYQAQLPSELRQLAVAVLANAPWDSVRADVQRLLPPPSAADSALPPIAELVKRSGDATHGKQTFGMLCMTCHQVDGVGVDYGPNLSAIGSKLGKDGLYQAVLYPDAGIEFNFETTVLALRSGDSAIGILVSETHDEVAIKAIGGIVSRYRKADIVERHKQRTSSMPSNLQAGLRVQDLVDLIEFLSSLRTK